MNSWSILGIDETKDINRITSAYREKLSVTHPEDNPEGFKALRSAYEEALAFANKAEEESMPLTEVEQWIEKIKEVYEDFYQRRDEKVWKELLQDPVAVSLESSHEASEKLLEFLLDKYRLSPGTLKLFSDHFGWEENREELSQHYHPNFLNYIFNTIYSGSYLRLDYFDGDKHADYDSYMTLANDFMDYVYYEDYENAKSTLEKMDEMEIFHPYVELERAKYLLKIGETEKADHITAGIIKEHPEEFPAQATRALVLWKNAHYEEAMILYRKLAEKSPDFLLSKLREVEYSLVQKKYKETKEKYYELLKGYYYECLREFHFDTVFKPIVDEANQYMIPYYEEMLEKGQMTPKDKIDLGWCYYESAKEQQALDLLESFQPDEETYKKYHKLRGLLHYYLESYDKVIPDFEIWTKEIFREMERPEFKQDEKTKEELTEEQYNRKKLSYEVDISKILQMLSYAYDATGDNESALQTIHKAIEINPSDLNMYMTTIFYLSRDKKDMEIIRLCSDAMDQNGPVEDLLLQRAIASYNMGDYRASYADCEDIIAMGNPMPAAYTRKMQILAAWGLYEEYASTLEDLKNAFPDMKMTKLYELKQIRFTDGVYKEIKQLNEMIKEAEMDKESFNDYDVAQIYYERYLCYNVHEDDPNALKKAMESIDKALEIDPNNIEYIVNKGSLLEKDRTKDGYEKARQLYQSVLDKYPQQIDMLICLGVLHHNMGDDKASLEYNKQVIDLYPGYDIYVYNYASDALKNMGDYEQSIDYLVEKLKWERSSRTLLEVGTALMESMRLSEAIDYLEEAYAMEPDETQLNCVLGMTYHLQKNKDKAEQYLRKSIELFDDSFYGYNPFYHLARFYFMNRRFEESIEIAEIAIERFDAPVWALERKIEALANLKRFDEAIAFTKEQINSSTDEDKDISMTCSLAEVYAAMGEDQTAEKTILKKYAEYKNSPYMVKRVAYFYEYRLNNPQSALKCYEKAYEFDNEDYHNMVNMSSCIWHLLEQGESKKKLSIFGGNKNHKLKQDLEIYFMRMQQLKDRYMNVEPPFVRGCDIASVAEMYFYNNYIEEAEKYCHLALEYPACGNCMAYESTDAYYLLGLIEEKKGNRQKAIEYMEKAVDTTFFNRLYQQTLQKMKQ